MKIKIIICHYLMLSIKLKEEGNIIVNNRNNNKQRFLITIQISYLAFPWIKFIINKVYKNYNNILGIDYLFLLSHVFFFIDYMSNL